MIAVPSTGAIAGPRKFEPREIQTFYDGAGFREFGAVLGIAPPLPPGNPGQMMVALLHTTGNNVTTTVPVGWDTIRDQATSNAGATINRRLTMACRVRQAGDAAPSFGFSGSSAGLVWIMGFTPTVGTLTYETSTGSSSPSGSNKTTAGLTLTAARNLILVAMLRWEFWSAAHNSLQAANITALNPDGLTGDPSPFNVSKTRWDNIFWLGDSSPACGIQLMGLADVDPGTTGTFTSSNSGNPWAMIAANFRWVI